MNCNPPLNCFPCHSDNFVYSLFAFFFFLFFNEPATTEIYPLSLHDPLPICAGRPRADRPRPAFDRSFHQRRARGRLSKLFLKRPRPPRATLFPSATPFRAEQAGQKPVG